MTDKEIDYLIEKYNPWVTREHFQFHGNCKDGIDRFIDRFIPDGVGAARFSYFKDCIGQRVYNPVVIQAFRIAIRELIALGRIPREGRRS